MFVKLKLGLIRKGDFVELYNMQGDLMDFVMYETNLPWPIEPFETAASLELKSPGYDNNLYSSWEAGPPGGTPGQQNSTYTSNEFVCLEKVNASCFPSHFTDFTTLKFNSNNSKNYTITLLDIQGNIKKTIQGEFIQEGMHYLDIFTEESHYSNGIYLVNIRTGNTSETIKVVKY